MIKLQSVVFFFLTAFTLLNASSTFAQFPVYPKTESLKIDVSEIMAYEILSDVSKWFQRHNTDASLEKYFKSLKTVSKLDLNPTLSAMEWKAFLTSLAGYSTEENISMDSLVSKKIDTSPEYLLLSCAVKVISGTTMQEKLAGLDLVTRNFSTKQLSPYEVDVLSSVILSALQDEESLIRYKAVLLAGRLKLKNYVLRYLTSKFKNENSDDSMTAALEASLNLMGFPTIAKAMMYVVANKNQTSYPKDGQVWMIDDVGTMKSVSKFLINNEGKASAQEIMRVLYSAATLDYDPHLTTDELEKYENVSYYDEESLSKFKTEIIAGDPFLNNLRIMVEDPLPKKRIAALKELESHGLLGKSGYAIIRSLANTESILVRFHMIKAAGLSAQPEIGFELIEYLIDPYYTDITLESLIRLANKAVIPKLQECKGKSKDSVVSYKIEKAIAKLNSY